MEIKRDFYLNKLVEWIIRGVAVKGRAVAFFFVDVIKKVQNWLENNKNLFILCNG